MDAIGDASRIRRHTRKEKSDYYAILMLIYRHNRKIDQGEKV